MIGGPNEEIVVDPSHGRYDRNCRRRVGATMGARVGQSRNLAGAWVGRAAMGACTAICGDLQVIPCRRGSPARRLSGRVFYAILFLLSILVLISILLRVRV